MKIGEYLGFVLSVLALSSPVVAIVQHQETASVKLKADLVTVDVIVEDERGKLLRGLGKEDFILSEEKVPQEITHFGFDEKPLSVALVVDTSDSMQFGFGAALKAAHAIVNFLRPQDEIALFNCHDQAQLLSDFGTGREQVAEILSSIHWKHDGGIRVNDAVMAATQHLRKVPANRKRVTVIITDDEPVTGNRYSKSEALHQALEADNIVYCVRIRPKALFPLTMMNFGRIITRFVTVKTYADETGGSVVTIRNEQELAAKLPPFLDQLRSGYVLGYYPSNRAQEGFRRIKVELTKEAQKRYGLVRLHYRRGYMAPKAKETGDPHKEAHSRFRKQPMMPR